MNEKFFIPVMALIVIVLVALIVPVLDTSSPRLPPPVTSTKNLAAPSVQDFIFTPLDQKAMRLSNLKGKIILLNFWATWCAPCVTEMPILAEFPKKFPGRVVLLALSSDRDLSAVRAFIKKLQTTGSDLTAPGVFVAIDSGRKITRDLFQIDTYPETLVIGPNGQVARHIVGPAAWQDGTGEKAIQALLNSD